MELAHIYIGGCCRGMIILKALLKKILLPLKQLVVAIVQEAIAAELKRLEARILLELAEYYADFKQTPAQFKQQLLDDLELRLQRSLAKVIKSKLF